MIKIFLLLLGVAQAASGYPPIEYLAEKFHVTPGAQLPEQIEWHGTVYNAFVKHGTALGGGDYQVVIHLAPR